MMLIARALIVEQLNATIADIKKQRDQDSASADPLQIARQAGYYDRNLKSFEFILAHLVPGDGNGYINISLMEADRLGLIRM